MEVSTENSKIVTVSKNNISADISMNGRKLEEITSFKTLGAHLSKDGTHSTEIRIRVTLAMAAMAEIGKGNAEWSTSSGGHLCLCRNSS